MKAEYEYLENFFGKLHTAYSQEDVVSVMKAYANKFGFSGEPIIPVSGVEFPKQGKKPWVKPEVRNISAEEVKRRNINLPKP